MKKKIETAAVIETAAFIHWFRNSVIVDRDGMPRVVYHGTTERGAFGDGAPFDTFNIGALYKGEDEEGDGDEKSYLANTSGVDVLSFLGAHFAKNRRVAERFAAGLYRRKKPQPAQGYVFEVYLRIEHPLRINDEHDLYLDILSQRSDSALVDDYFEMMAETEEDGQTVKEQATRYDKSVKERRGVHDLILRLNILGFENPDDAAALADDLADSYRAKLKAKGYDGVIYNNRYEGGTAYIVFEPTQIKAVNNNGKFGVDVPSVFAGLKRKKK